MKFFDEIIKDATVGDVHVPTDLGNEEDDESVDSAKFADDDDVVQIYVTKDDAIVGFDGRRLEPTWNSLVKIALPVASLGDAAISILKLIVNRNSFVTKSVPISSLTFMGEEVLRSEVEKDVRKVVDGALEQPIVAKINGKDFVITEAPTVLAHWLNGEDQIAVKYCDAEALQKNDDSLDVKFKVEKAVPDQQLIFGWASVVTKAGKPIVDKQGDIIPVPELEKAFYDYVLNDRAHGHMHENVGTGRLVECMVFTKEKQDLFKIDLGFEGAWVGYIVDDPKVWAAHKRGDLPEFSIGGFAVHEPV